MASATSIWTFIRWSLWAGYAIGWALALTMPYPIDPGEDRQLRDNVFWLGKAGHVAGYAALTILTGWLRVPRPKCWGLVALLSVHAAGTEWLQNFDPSRTPSWADVALNHAGLALGIAVTWKWWR